MCSISASGATTAADPIPVCAGIGLRFPHHNTVLQTLPAARWFEVHPENYPMHSVAAGILMTIRQSYPLSLHATALSLGSADGIDAAHLEMLAELCTVLEPGLVSDHLSWSAIGGVHVPDLLPLPYTEEALDIFARNTDRLQSRLRRQILVENPSVYIAFEEQEMEESEFLGELVGRTGCGVLLDVNNVAVSASNLGGDSASRLDALLAAIPAKSIGEIHVAGHSVNKLPGGATVRIDDHGSPVGAEAWSLLATTLARIGPRPVLVEWDTAIPSFETLMDEAGKADRMLAPVNSGADHVAAR